MAKDPRLARAGVEGFNKPKRNAVNIAKGKMSAAYWANKVKW